MSIALACLLKYQLSPTIMMEKSRRHLLESFHLLRKRIFEGNFRHLPQGKHTLFGIEEINFSGGCWRGTVEVPPQIFSFLQD